MTPAELVRATRRRKGLSQRRLAVHAGTSQSAVARIEGGREDVTWKRLSNLLIAMGEQPILSSEPLVADHDAAQMLDWRRMGPGEPLERALVINERASTRAHGPD